MTSARSKSRSSPAEAQLRKTIVKHEKTASKLALWMEKSIPEGLTVFAFPKAHQRKIRTTNGLERVNREVHRRTQVVSIFPKDAACLRLASAVLMEIDEEWQTGRVYVNFENDEPAP